MESSEKKPKPFTDAEAEAYTRYLTQTEKSKKKTLAEIFLETPLGKSLIGEWVRKMELKWKQ